MPDQPCEERVRPALARIRGAGDLAARFNVSRETLARLVTYVALLEQWQAKINLVAPGTLPDVWHRHVADSVQLFDLAPAGAVRWADLGSGAGFPGLVLAILLAGRPQSHERPRMTLVESDARKCAFLAEVTRKTGLASAIAVDIVNRRIESVPTQTTLAGTQVITARALASLDRLLGYAAPLFGPETVALLPKGRDVQAELAEAGRCWRFECRLWSSLTDAEARIVEVRHLEAKTEE